MVDRVEFKRKPFKYRFSPENFVKKYRDLLTMRMRAKILVEAWMMDGQPIASSILRRRAESFGVNWQMFMLAMRELGLSCRNKGTHWEWYYVVETARNHSYAEERPEPSRGRPGFVEGTDYTAWRSETMMAAHRRAGNGPDAIDQWKDDLGVVVVTMNDSQELWFVPVQAPLSPIMKRILGTETLDQFMEIDFADTADNQR
jgi:hypothetical protein